MNAQCSFSCASKLVTSKKKKLGMWPAGPSITFKYQAHNVSVHESVLQTKMVYFYRATTATSDDDVGFVNFHPHSKRKIFDLPWPAFEALVQWAYSGSLKPLFSHNADITYWSSVALILGMDELRDDLRRYNRWEWLTKLGHALLQMPRGAISRLPSRDQWKYLVSIFPVVGRAIEAFFVWLANVTYLALWVSLGTISLLLLLFIVALVLEVVPPEIASFGDALSATCALGIWFVQMTYCQARMHLTNTYIDARLVQWCDAKAMTGNTLLQTIFSEK